MIPVCIPTFIKYDTLNKLIRSLLEGTMLPSKIEILDNGCNYELPEEFKDVAVPITVYNEEFNLGVAAGWNYLIHKNLDSQVVIITNDDVEFLPDTMYTAYNEAMANEGKLLMTGYDIDSKKENWSLFTYRTEATDLIGWFDENFWPAYFEDNDYAYRLKLADRCHYINKKIEYHHVGSATLATYDERALERHHQRFKKNRSYYEKKWGGRPTEEILTSPSCSGETSY